MRGCATLMGGSEVTSKAKGWAGERLCDFDGDCRVTSQILGVKMRLFQIIIIECISILICF